MIARGDVRWTDLGPAVGSAPAKRRPVVVVQSDRYNSSRISTVVVVVITSNTGHATLPGNVFLPAGFSGLARDSVVDVSGLRTIDRSLLERAVGRVPDSLMDDVDAGLRSVLAL